MKTFVLTATAALTLLLGGCATTISSQVTTFHALPAQMADKSYAIDAPDPKHNTLELQSYENLVRQQLDRLGFQPAAPGARPALKVAMQFNTLIRPAHLVYNGLYSARSSLYFSPYRSRYSRFGYSRFGYSPFADPWGFNDPYYEVQDERYTRSVHITIRSARDDHMLFDVTVRNVSEEMSTPLIMPALVQSAFEGFPGPNGGARRIDLKLNDK
ncbi:MAG: DUF4136 domain-containing protein [Massilia sp.]